MSEEKNTFDAIYFQNGRYEYEFEEKETPIGGGERGIVFKARNKIDDKNYAIKKIHISGKLIGFKINIKI